MTTATATPNINQINLVGRLGKDPEVQVFESGATLTKLTLAVNRPTKNSQPDWFELELWGKTAEIAADYTNKGSLIGVEGELKLDEWNDKNTGLLRCKPVVKVNRLELLSSPNTNNSNGHSQAHSQSAQPQNHHQDDAF